MKRRNFFKLLSSTSMIPLMPVKKKEECPYKFYSSLKEMTNDGWDTNSSPADDVVDAIRHIVDAPYRSATITSTKFKKDGSVNIKGYFTIPMIKITGSIKI